MSTVHSTELPENQPSHVFVVSIMNNNWGHPRRAPFQVHTVAGVNSTVSIHSQWVPPWRSPNHRSHCPVSASIPDSPHKSPYFLLRGRSFCPLQNKLKTMNPSSVIRANSPFPLQISPVSGFGTGCPVTPKPLMTH